MVQRYLDRLVAVAALAAVMGGCLTPLSKADAQGTTDAAAKKKVEQFLGAGLPGKATVHFVDLNGDGVPEALVTGTTTRRLVGLTVAPRRSLTCVALPQKRLEVL